MGVVKMVLLTAAWLAGVLAASGGKAPPRKPEKPKEPKGTPVSAAELRKLLADWGAAQKKLKTVITEFTCEEENALLIEPQVTKGVIKIQKPDGYRREVYAEKKKGGRTVKELTGLMILKPPYLWVYLPKRKRAEEFDLKKVGLKAGNNPLKRLGDIISFDRARIEKSLKISAVKLKDDLYRLTYTPKGGKAIGNVKQVRVWMKKSARFLQKMETTSADGDVRTEIYTGTKFDEELDDALFKFKRPRGVKLIRVTK
jgi:outer membrane lipoprotein-sorting protein